MVRMGQYRSRRGGGMRKQLKRGGGISMGDVLTAGKEVVQFAQDNPEVVEKVGEIAEKGINAVGKMVGGSIFANKNPQMNKLFNQVARAAGQIDEVAHHPIQHHPEELLREAQKFVAKAPEVAHQIMEEHHDYPEFSLINPLTTRFPDHSVNPMAHALAARKLYVDTAKTNFDKRKKQKVGGAIDFKKAVDETMTFADNFNPASTVDKMMGNFDRVNLQDTSARGMAKNGLNLYAANLRGHAAYSQMTGLALTPAVALGAALPMAGFHATGVALNEGANVVDTVNRHI